MRCPECLCQSIDGKCPLCQGIVRELAPGIRITSEMIKEKIDDTDEDNKDKAESEQKVTCPECGKKLDLESCPEECDCGALLELPVELPGRREDEQEESDGGDVDIDDRGYVL